jgi:translation elongation factor EF-1alpha
LFISSFDLSARTALVAIETETDRVQWAAAGSNVTLYLTAVDPIHLDVGRVLCSPTAPVELASAFTARIIVFDIQVPILAGTSVSKRIDLLHLSCFTRFFRSNSFITLAMFQRRYLN